jgi:hypothetical protein
MSQKPNPHGRLSAAGRAFLFIAFHLAFAAVASARGVLVSPTQLGLSGKPGQTVSGVLYVSSSKAEKNRITVTLAEFTRDEDGKVIGSETAHARSARAWLDVDRTDFLTLESGRTEVTVSARIPDNASGSYWALIYLQAEPAARDPKRGSLMFRVVPRVGIPVIVTAEGTTKPQLRIIETRAKRVADGVEIYSTVENSGNTAVLISGAFSLERQAANSTDSQELASDTAGPFTSMPGTKLKVKTQLKYNGSLAGVQAHAYVRFGPRPEDTAEAATAIEAQK